MRKMPKNPESFRRSPKLAPLAGIALVMAVLTQPASSAAPAGPATPAAPATPAPGQDDRLRVPPGGPAPAAPIGNPPTPVPGLPSGSPAPDPAIRARAAAVAAKANIDISEAWTRATPGSATTAAVYMNIDSNKDADKLIGVEVAVADKAEVHDEMNQNGVMKMNAVPSVDIPAGSSVHLAPGGRHIMLTGLKGPLKEGDSFLITLKFDKAGTENTVVKILGAAATGLPPISSTRKGDTTAGVSQR